MSIADANMARRAGAIIKRWGTPAKLLRGTALRDCTAAILGNSPRARALAMEEALQVLIAAPLTTVPDHEQDHLILDGKKYAIVAPVKGPRPGGQNVFYDCDVVYQSAYP